MLFVTKIITLNNTAKKLIQKKSLKLITHIMTRKKEERASGKFHFQTIARWHITIK